MPTRTSTPAAADRHQVRTATWPAMGSQVSVTTLGGGDGLLDLARSRIDHLESRWSRFRPDSELSRLTQQAGRWTAVSDDTAALLALMADAHHRTGGLVDARVTPHLQAAGYDRPVPRWPADGDPPLRLDHVPHARPRPRVAPGGTSRLLDLRPGQVRLADDRPLDPGCCGKGLAADLVAAQLVGAGAAGVVIDVGGDVAVAGRPPDCRGFGMVVTAPDGTEMALLALEAGGVATSSTCRRRWIGPDGRARHHLIDPRTGQPADTDVAQVTVIGRSAAEAEVLATAVAVGGTAGARHVLDGLPALVRTLDGTVEMMNEVQRWMR